MTDPLESAAKHSPTVDPEDAVREVTAAHKRISDEVHKVIVGQEEVLDQLLTTLFCGLPRLRSAQVSGPVHA